jgi:cytochrome c556
MVKTWASTVVTVLGCFAALAVHAQTPPAISTDSQGNVTVTGNDLTVVAGGMAAISVRQLAADVEALKSATAVLQNLTALFPTTQEVSSNTPNMHEASVHHAHGFGTFSLASAEEHYSVA